MAQQLLASSLTLDRVFANAVDGVFVVDRTRRYVLVNPAFERITGYSSRELLGRQCTCSDVVHCKDDYGRYLGGVLCPARAITEGDINQARQRMQITRRDGSRAWVETLYSTIRDGAGRVEFVLGVVRDASESKEREDELKQCMTDLRQQLGDRPDAAPLNGGHACNAPAACTATNPGNGSSLKLDHVLEDVERQAIRRALEAAGGQRTRAAQIMGISRSRLYRRIDALGIDHAEPG
jgi:PAS domain S-box-containing protein